MSWFLKACFTFLNVYFISFSFLTGQGYAEKSVEKLFSPEFYTGNDFLDNQHKVHLVWNISQAEKTIYFEITAQTIGYVGFGISPNGNMTAADILLAGVYQNGTVYYQDTHGVGNSDPIPDKLQDWFVTDAKEMDGLTTIKFHRLLNTCDMEDFPITDETMHLIWAIGDSDELIYHASERGTKSVMFYLQPGMEFEPENFEKFDLLVNLTMPKEHTTYWSTIHKAPLFNRTHHIVALEAVLENTPAVQHTHHFIVYQCIAPSDIDPNKLFERWTTHPGDYAYSPTIKDFPFLQYCARHPFYFWGTGGKRLVFSPEMGIPIPEKVGRMEYYALEIHYDNPKGISGLRFQTGARFYYTSKLRDIDIGLMRVDHGINIQLTVPPNVSNYVVAGHCSSECTEKYLPEEGITIFSSFLHAHLAGRKLKLRHFRGNEELPWIDVDNYYDFNYQQNKLLAKPRKVLKGDQLTVECTYDSTGNQGRIVTGGLSTHEEMCEAILYYYPKQSMSICGSTQDIKEHMELLGILNYTRKNSSVAGDISGVEIQEPEDLQGDYHEVVSYKVNWSYEYLMDFQTEKRYGEQKIFCVSAKETFVGKEKVKYPENFKQFMVENECQTGGRRDINHIVYLMIALAGIFVLFMAWMKYHK